MIIFKNSELVIESKELTQVNSNIRSRIGKRHSLWFVSTASWIIFPGRIFVGKENRNGTVTVARMRRPFWQIVPKVYSTWSLEKDGDNVRINLKHKMGFLAMMFLLIFLIQWVSNMVVFGQLSGEMIGYGLIVTMIFNLLLWREARSNEKRLTQIAKKGLSQ